MPYTYPYPHPALSTDCIIVKDQAEILLIRRKKDPFRDQWALPGGFVEEGEDLVDAARRELAEETGLDGIPLGQFRTFGKPGRDPRGWTVSVVFYGIINGENSSVQPGDDAAETKWFPINKLPQMAFDHRDIIMEFLRFSKK